VDHAPRVCYIRATMRNLTGITVAALLALAGGAFASDFVGARRCKGCHTAEYDQWRLTPHAQATARLTAEQRRDRRCTVCHATSTDDGFLGVQCESCHGPGRYYWPDFVMKDTELAKAVGLQSGGDASVCGRCHTADVPTVTAFDAQAALPKVRHRTEAR
jgi:hypothetical protein